MHLSDRARPRPRVRTRSRDDFMILATTEFTITALLLGTFGVLLLTCALLGRTVERVGIPVVFLFLFLGIIAGSEGLGGLAFDDYLFAFRVGTVALILILLDGGLNTSLRAIRQCFLPAVVLATAGVAATAALVAGCGWLLGLTWPEAVLLGAVVSSTDAAAVFAVLRGGGIRLKPRLGATIELESGINDPMAVILTVTATMIFLGRSPGPVQLALDVPLQLLLGLAIGLAVGYSALFLMRRIRLGTVGFYPVLTLGFGLVAFGAATLSLGSGFLAVFAAGVVLGNGPLPYRSGLTRIHDALGWLSQVTMFLMLGLLIFPSALMPVAREGFLIALFLSFVARPLAVLVCLAPFGFPLREILYIGWVGLRGAVPIILAMFPVLSGVPGAQKVFNIVFFIVAMSALLPGVTIRWLTRRLGLEAEGTPTPPAVLEVNSTSALTSELISFYITEPLAVCGATLADIPFPTESAVALVIRGEDLLAPRGTTVLRPGDHVYVFCRIQDKPLIELLFGRPQQD